MQDVLCTNQISSRICSHCTISREPAINIKEWGRSVDQHGEQNSVSATLPKVSQARKWLKNFGCKDFVLMIYVHAKLIL